MIFKFFNFRLFYPSTAAIITYPFRPEATKDERNDAIIYIIEMLLNPKKANYFSDIIEKAVEEKEWLISSLDIIRSVEKYIENPLKILGEDAMIDYNDLKLLEEYVLSRNNLNLDVGADTQSDTAMQSDSDSDTQFDTEIQPEQLVPQEPGVYFPLKDFIINPFKDFISDHVHQITIALLGSFFILILGYLITLLPFWTLNQPNILPEVEEQPVEESVVPIIVEEFEKKSNIVPTNYMYIYVILLCLLSIAIIILYKIKAKYK